MVRTAFLLIALFLAALVTAAPASAHAQWLGSDPEEGAVLTELPAAVLMTYSEDIASAFVDTAVIPPGGDPIPTEGTADGVDVSIDLTGSADVVDVADQPGQWQVVARVVSVDGHPIEHTTTFEVAAVSDRTPAPGASSLPAQPPSPDLSASDASSPGASTPGSSTAEPAASAEPGLISTDPVAGAADELPTWVVPLVVLALLAAGAAAVVVGLRRQSPGA